MLKRLKWLSIPLLLVWVLLVAVVWLMAAVFIGGYLLIRRVLRPNEKWPEDEWLDDSR